MYICQVLVYIILLNIVDAEDFEASRNPLIINGEEAVPGQFKYVVALYYRGEYICGGSIIGRRTVLTAAHCYAYNDLSYRWADDYHGIANVNRSASGYKIKFSKATVHRDYNGVDNDIAVLIASKDIPFDEEFFIKPVCIHSYHIIEFPYLHATAMGWGKTNPDTNDNELPEILRYVEQSIKTNFVCSHLNDAITKSKVCGYGPKTGICSGDSGGPFVHSGILRSPVQIGIASYINKQYGCAGRAPDVYTRVNYYTDWIKQVANDSSICYK